MVKLEEVPDEELYAEQEGPKVEDEDEWDTDDGITHFNTSPNHSKHRS